MKTAWVVTVGAEVLSSNEGMGCSHRHWQRWQTPGKRWQHGSNNGNDVQKPFSLCTVLRSDVAIMNWVITAITGVSSCFLSILAQMLQNTEGAAFVSETTSQATLVFDSTVCGRLVTALILIYADRSADS